MLLFVGAFFFFFCGETVDGKGKKVRPKLTPGLCGGPVANGCTPKMMARSRNIEFSW